MNRRPVVGERLGGVLGLLACLALAVVVALVVPDPSTDVRRRYDDVGVGEVGSTRLVSARVDAVQLTTSAKSEYGDPFVSREVLVVVGVDVSVRRQVVRFGEVVLRTRSGAEYEPRSEFIDAGLSETTPGFSRTSTLVFEVPPDRLPGAQLVFDPDGAAFDAYAEAIRVDLGLRAPLTVSAGPVEVPESTVRVT